jgi:hypothetical protein
MNPALQLRMSASGPTFAPSTPGFALVIQPDGKSVAPQEIVNSNTGVFVVPALSASFADVTIQSPGYNVGDVFALSMETDPGAPRLANVAAVAAWVGSADHLTVRFFGTNAGGAQVLNIARVHAAPSP